ncbi:MAG: PDZ domain-containing protein [Gemmatimonadetes bacterium]|nr:PDZ domain-containing protein [Gemmatimonadota bacterium]
MRNLTHSLLFVLLAAAPAAAQDTSVMIQNKDCTVKVDGKRLPQAEETKACERMRTASARMQEQAVRMQAQSVQMQRQAERMASEVARTGVQERAITGQMRAVEEATRGAAGAQIRMRSDLAERATAGRMAELDATNRLAEVRAGAMLRENAIASGRLAEARSLTGRAMLAIAARPRLGITIDTRARDTDRWGAYVTAVTPGGPADKGGVRSGDVIAKLAGKAVTGSGDETPGIKLIAMIGALEPNKRIEVQLRRGNGTKTVKVTPSNDDSFFAGPAIVVDSVRRAYGTVMDVPGFAGVRSRSGGNMETLRLAEINGDPMTRGSYSFTINTAAMGGPLAALEMTSLNAGLGSYFGATEGVLVINVGEKQELGLQAGDVVTSVDGRKVTSPAQLARILRTYETGEEYKLQIMRQKKTETVTGKMP